MKDFSSLWLEFAKRKNLVDYDAKIEISVINLRDLLKKFYDKGKEEGKEEGSLLDNSLFGKIFGGGK